MGRAASAAAQPATSERTADLSRRHGIRVSHAGVVTITGGKLTTYRAMAEDTVDQVDQLLDGRAPAVPHQAAPAASARAGYQEPPDGGSTTAAHLARRYGTEASAVQGLIARDPALGEPLVPGLPYVQAEAVFAVRDEMARTLDDVLDRRTRAAAAGPRRDRTAAESVARLLAPELGWDDDDIAPCGRRVPRRARRRTSGGRAASVTGAHVSPPIAVRGRRRTRQPRLDARGSRAA